MRLSGGPGPDRGDGRGGNGLGGGGIGGPGIGGSRGLGPSGHRLGLGLRPSGHGLGPSGFGLGLGLRPSVHGLGPSGFGLGVGLGRYGLGMGDGLGGSGRHGRELHGYGLGLGGLGLAARGLGLAARGLGLGGLGLGNLGSRIRDGLGGLGRDGRELDGLGLAALGLGSCGLVGFGRHGAGRGRGLGRRYGRGGICCGGIYRGSVYRGRREAGRGLVVARILIPCDSAIVSIRINNVIQFVRFNLLRRQFRLGLLGWPLFLRRPGCLGGFGRLRHTGILGGCSWVTRCNHHVTVIPITPLTLTTVRNITGHMVLGRVVKLGSDASTRAGLAPAGR